MVLVFICVFSVEIGFRIFLNLRGKDVITVLSKKEVLEKAWFQPHPHLLYVFKPNSSFIMNRYKYGQFTINQFGFRSTLDFDVQSIKKPANTLRIATFGGSTTMGVNDDSEIWPYLIGKYLSNNIQNKNVEILNEGIMGYTSLDNLLDLSMRVIDFNCDIYVLYLGVNDLLPRAPLRIYRTDNAHFRRTLHENLSYASFFPSWLLRLKSFRAILQLYGIPDSRGLINNTGTGQFRRGFKVPKEERALVSEIIRQTVIRNIKSMVGIIRAHRPDALIILSSFYDLKNRQILNDLNDDFMKLALQLDLIFIDAANEVPKEQDMVYDYGHFTPKGDRHMGKLFADAIIKNLTSNVTSDKDHLTSQRTRMHDSDVDFDF